MTPIHLALIVVCGVGLIGLMIPTLIRSLDARRVRSRIIDGVTVVGRGDPLHSLRSLTPGMLCACVGIAGSAIALVVDGVVLAVLAGVASSSVFVVSRDIRRSKATRRYLQSMPAVLDAYLLSVRSGAGFTGALREASAFPAGDVAADLALVVQALDRGADVDTALSGWRDRRRTRAVDVLTSCLAIAHRTGGSTADAAEAVRATVRNAIVAEDAVRTNSAQARASAFVLAALPLVLSGPMIAANDASRSFMFHTPIGVVALTTGLILNGLGFWWMARLVKAVET